MAVAIDMAAAAARLLDFTQPLDVPLLESVVDLASGPTDLRAQAERLLLQYQEHPQSWQQVDGILSSAQSQATKYFALQVRGAGLRGNARVLSSSAWSCMAPPFTCFHASTLPTLPACADPGECHQV